ncbi:hypothetical protein VP758_001540 [Vibrio harveyi]|nr:hypothetical protein [Vibrio harveyi]
MKRFIPSVMKEEVEDLVMAQLYLGPKRRKELDEVIGKQTKNALVRLKDCGAIELTGNQRSTWQVTGKSYRETCLNCSGSVFVWRTDVLGICHTCRQIQNTASGASKTNKEMYREFDDAAPFNKVLRLPFGLSPAHYEACLNRN